MLNWIPVLVAALGILKKLTPLPAFTDAKQTEEWLTKMVPNLATTIAAVSLLLERDRLLMGGECCPDCDYDREECEKLLRPMIEAAVADGTLPQSWLTEGWVFLINQVMMILAAIKEASD